MEPLPGSGRGTRLTLLALGLLLLLAVVAFASRSGFGHHSHETAPSARYTSYALSAFLILFVLMIPVAVYAYFLRFREAATAAAHKGFKARVIGSMLRLGVILLIAFVLFSIRRDHPGLLDRFRPFGVNPVAGAHGHGRHAQDNPTFQWSVLWIALVLLTAAGAFAFYQWRTRKPVFAPRDPELTVAEDFVASIDDAIHDLESEPDARRAVIAAYARMEAALGRNGLRRAPSETALEYLRRVLLELSARGEPVQRLTALFEQAKFSDHAIDDAMKQDAIAALRTIRDDLRGAAA
ncbi:MAG: DUF4129 domain-containing protein [Gaiellaceae bacterium]